MVLGTLLVCLVLLFLVLFVDSNEGLIGLATAGFIVGTILSIATFVECFMHCSDLGKLRSGTAIVSVQEERIERLQLQLNSINQQPTALANADSPITTIVTQLSQATSDLSAAKTDMAQAVVNIETRKAGPMWFVVSMYGDR